MSAPVTAGPSSSRRHPTRPRLLQDVLLAVVCFVVFGLSSLVTFGFSGFGTRDGAPAIVLLAGVLMCGAMVWRASNPVPATILVYFTALAHFAAGFMLLPIDALIFLALYSVTVHGPRWAERLGLAGALVGGLLVSTVFAANATTRLEAVFLVAFGFAFAATAVLLFWSVGLLRRSRSDRTESLRERAARLELERDQQAQLATAAERNRIAREMHDIVAHSLSVVIAQADGGRYAAAADPAAAVTALSTISETGRAALADMRRILGVLRDEDGQAADLIPQPADADIVALLEQVRRSGLEVSHVDLGTPRPMPPGTGVAVYRIVQEALTNVLKHAGPHARVTVTTQWTPAELVLTVEDDGRGAAAATEVPGYGLVGMKERASMLGGALIAGPRPGGGFRTRATIPIPGGAP
ncbi:sensor histidine kinase [Pseudactinotalea sp. HY158]|uniref:sensor histidine kinase n=1 Tax=Pseudactinotalea sp. HY158 TaxID=2654547 RepID=UPI00129CA413|nr:sensor histidine kinase [Pseudactinotalea sp. HY158]QGH70237.1 sensor histidine kinase [Pseudactinotalea sp. HY158]